MGRMASSGPSPFAFLYESVCKRSSPFGSVSFVLFKSLFSLFFAFSQRESVLCFRLFSARRRRPKSRAPNQRKNGRISILTHRTKPFIKRQIKELEMSQAFRRVKQEGNTPVNILLMLLLES